ncbi:hypothetical protein ACIBHX_20540 [Nonomuraea sp. NPDC050536]|uniref:hypothetical protein n=1 Tax=Nonomuraea sp. NPDC050536 TaxID=3364366 RepID=UPI0037C74CC7
MRAVTRMADRLLEMIVPHTVARATDCGYECCSGWGIGRYCCYYPDGHRSCGSCHRYDYCY